MDERKNIFNLPVSSATRESSSHVMEGLLSGTYRQQNLTNAATPFTEKQPVYLSSYDRSVRSINHRYILDCRGEEE